MTTTTKTPKLNAPNVNLYLSLNGLSADHLTARNGLFTWKHSFFYRHQTISQEALRSKLQTLIPGVHIVEIRDDAREWPKTSYVVALFRLPENFTFDAKTIEALNS